MEKAKAAFGDSVSKNKKERKYFNWFKNSDIRKNIELYILVVPAILITVLFCYIPMLGIIIAFQKYDPFKGLFGSRWIGFENFKFFFSGSEWFPITINTLYLNIIFISTGTLASIIIAIIMTEIKSKAFTRVGQSLMTLPNFVSWATIALFSTAFLASDGVINKVLGVTGGSIDF